MASASVSASASIGDLLAALGDDFASDVDDEANYVYYAVTGRRILPRSSVGRLRVAPGNRLRGGKLTEHPTVRGTVWYDELESTLGLAEHIGDQWYRRFALYRTSRAEWCRGVTSLEWQFDGLVLLPLHSDAAITALGAGGERAICAAIRALTALNGAASYADLAIDADETAMALGHGSYGRLREFLNTAPLRHIITLYQALNESMATGEVADDVLDSHDALETLPPLYAVLRELCA